MLTAIVVVAIVLAAIYAWARLRPVPPIDADFSGEVPSISTDMPAPEVFRVVEALPVSSRYKLGRADAERGRIIFDIGMGAFNYGYFLAADIAAAGPGSTLTLGIRPKYGSVFGSLQERDRQKALDAFAETVRAKLAGAI